MTIKMVSDKNPTANLAINKSRIKKYGKKKSIPTYYLEKGQEFQIELYNPTQEKVLTTIKLNNKAISGGLVLRPGERVFLDRFLETNKKFLFDTYTVDNTKSSRKAIEPNGDVEIAFFKEITTQNNIYLCGGTGTVTLDYNPTFTTNSVNYLSTNTGALSDFNDSNITLTSKSGDLGVGSASSSSTLSLSGELNLNYDIRGISQVNSPKSLKSKTRSVNYNQKINTPIKIETGRVEQGSSSNQKLCEATGDFEMMSFHVVRYKLLPKSQEKLSSKDYYTKYCGDCGAKVKTKFCPYCGAKQ